MANAARYAARLAKKALVGTAKGINKGVQTVATDYAELGVDAATKTGKFIGKHAFTKEDKSFWNGYTGLKESDGLKAAAWVGTAAWGVGAIAYKNQTMDKSQSNVTVASEMPSTTYDYVSSAPTLGASGSMVFGLHNGRKG